MTIGGSMRIGIDIDGVCYQWSKTARFMLREVLPNSPYTKDGPMGQESTDWRYIPDNVDKKHWNWLWDEGIKLGMFRHGDMYAGTPEALKKLAKMGDLVAITMRPKRAAQDTFDWISYNRLPFSEVHVLQGESKLVVAPCDYYIDDKPENCFELAINGTACLRNQPWNQKVNQDAMDENGVIRVDGWNEFIHIIRDETQHEKVS